MFRAHFFIIAFEIDMLMSHVVCEVSAFLMKRGGGVFPETAATNRGLPPVFSVGSHVICEGLAFPGWCLLIRVAS